MLEIRIGDYRTEVHPAENPRYTSRLVLVHGLWVGAWCWREFGSFLAHRGWEVVAPDLRGRPGSRASKIEPITVDDYLEDVVEVLRSVGDSPPVVVGHGLGGWLALAAATRVRVRAVVALAPPLPAALTDDFRQVLRCGGGILRRPLPPPRSRLAEEGLDMSRLQSDSPRVGRSLVEGEPVLTRPGVPGAVVASARDPWLDPRILEIEARELGLDFLTRDAGHWALSGRAFERQVDVVHRWLVSRLGEGLLRLTGFEDLEEDDGEPGLSD